MILASVVFLIPLVVDAEARPIRQFTIEARQYAYNPPIIRVHRGDEVHIRLVSKDVVHGFYLEGHDINARVVPERETFIVRQAGEEKEVAEIVFVAKRTGKFRYRCSHTCGYLHPFMMGELIVSPNYLYRGSVAGALLLLAGAIAIGLFRKKKGEEGSLS